MLAVLRHVSGVVTVVLVAVRVSLAVCALDSHHASAAVHLHLGQLGGNDGTPLTDHGRALLLLVRHRHGSILRCGLLNLANQEFILGQLDEVNTDVGETVDKD